MSSQGHVLVTMPYFELQSADVTLLERHYLTAPEMFKVLSLNINLWHSFAIELLKKR